MKLTLKWQIFCGKIGNIPSVAFENIPSVKFEHLPCVTPVSYCWLSKTEIKLTLSFCSFTLALLEFTILCVIELGGCMNYLCTCIAAQQDTVSLKHVVRTGVYLLYFKLAKGIFLSVFFILGKFYVFCSA